MQIRLKPSQTRQCCTPLQSSLWRGLNLFWVDKSPWKVGLYFKRLIFQKDYISKGLIWRGKPNQTRLYTPLESSLWPLSPQITADRRQPELGYTSKLQDFHRHKKRRKAKLGRCCCLLDKNQEILDKSICLIWVFVWTLATFLPCLLIGKYAKHVKFQWHRKICTNSSTVCQTQINPFQMSATFEC